MNDLTPENLAFLIKIGQITDAPAAPKAAPVAAPVTAPVADSTEGAK